MMTSRYSRQKSWVLLGFELVQSLGVFCAPTGPQQGALYSSLIATLLELGTLTYSASTYESKVSLICTKNGSTRSLVEFLEEATA
jgi:hypothetical protein